MEDKNTGKKPLRSISNKFKDIKDTYMKQEGGRPIPIHDMENEDMKQQEETQNSEATTINDEQQETEQAQQEQTVMDIEDVKRLADDMNNEINQLQKERDELKDQLLRKAAELENIRQRTIREKQELMNYSNEKLLFKMLDLLDNLSNAIEVGKKSEDYQSLLKGMELINNLAQKLFTDEGVKLMENPVGTEFNVDYHDALMAQASNLPEHHVVHQVQPGYMIKDKVLRHAKVVTSTGIKPE